jgi:hypothetical protein
LTAAAWGCGFMKLAIKVHWIFMVGDTTEELWKWSEDESEAELRERAFPSGVWGKDRRCIALRLCTLRGKREGALRCAYAPYGE